MERKNFIRSVCLLFLMALAVPANALLVPRSISELTKKADAVITGRVINIESQWNNDQNTIFTYVTIEVDQVMKNATPKKKFDQITLRLHGGTVGDTIIGVTDMPKFDFNEQVFLFLEIDKGKNPPSSEGDRLGDFTVRGKEMGKFTIVENMVDIKDYKYEIKGKMALQDFLEDINDVISGQDIEKTPRYMDPKNLK